MNGLFITLEGPEGSGKTTQIKLLNSYLTEIGYNVVQTREPGGTKVGDRIREILLDSQLEDIKPKTELLLYSASRAQHVTEVIKPALKEGKVVLCDRFSDATLAYQGYGRQINKDLIKGVNEVATGGLKPDLTFLLDIEPEVGLVRAKNLAKDSTEVGIGDRIENEDLTFHQQVRAGYLNLAKKEERFEVVDAKQSVDEIFQYLIGKLEERLRIYEDSK
jgi:dTMP kinase